MIDVDAVTLAELEATGVVAGADAGHGGKPLTAAWVGPTSDPTGTSTSSKPTSTSSPKPAPAPTWVGPTDVPN
jgi:hypothetical protein